MTGLQLVTAATSQGWRWQVCLNGKSLCTGVCSTRDEALSRLKRWVTKFV